MFFADLIGRHTIVEDLIQSYQKGRTAHTQLFLGSGGGDTLALALAYAHYLLCEQPGENDACGQCNACHKNRKHIHPDLHFSYPTVGSQKLSTDFIAAWRKALQEEPYLSQKAWLGRIGTENQQGNITVKECVDIVQKLSLKRLEGRFKIMILWLPEFLAKEGNRLLKLIEEPDENTLFIFVAEDKEKILNTILSRCQILSIPPLRDGDVEQILTQRFEVEEEKARAIAFLASGSITKALSIYGDTDNNFTELFFDCFRVAFKGHGREMVAWSEAMITGKHYEKKIFNKMGRKELVLFFHYALSFLREASLLLLGQSEDKVRLSSVEIATAEKLLKLLDFSKVQDLKQLFDDTSYYIERNANPKLALLDMMIQLHKILVRAKTLV